MYRKSLKPYQNLHYIKPHLHTWQTRFTYKRLISFLMSSRIAGGKPTNSLFASLTSSAFSSSWDYIKRSLLILSSHVSQVISENSEKNKQSWVSYVKLLNRTCKLDVFEASKYLTILDDYVDIPYIVTEKFSNCKNWLHFNFQILVKRFHYPLMI